MWPPNFRNLFDNLPMVIYDETGKPIKCRDATEWMEFMTTHRIVMAEHVGPLFVSTVFLGVARSIGRTTPFETIIFDGQDGVMDQYQYATLAEAKAGHTLALDLAKALVASAGEAADQLLSKLGGKA